MAIEAVFEEGRGEKELDFFWELEEALLKDVTVATDREPGPGVTTYTNWDVYWEIPDRLTENGVGKWQHNQ